MSHLAVSVTLLSSFLLSPAALACSIQAGVPYDPYTAERAQSLSLTSSKIYAGQVTHSIDRVESPDSERPILGKLAILKVSRGWSSPATELSERVPYATHGRCPPQNEEMRIGEKYLVFIGTSGAYWFPLSDAGPMIAFLGEPHFEYLRGQVHYRHNKSLNQDASEAGSG